MPRHPVNTFTPLPPTPTDGARRTTVVCDSPSCDPTATCASCHCTRHESATCHPPRSVPPPHQIAFATQCGSPDDDTTPHSSSTHHMCLKFCHVSIIHHGTPRVQHDHHVCHTCVGYVSPPPCTRASTVSRGVTWWTSRVVVACPPLGPPNFSREFFARGGPPTHRRLPGSAGGGGRGPPLL